MIDLYYWTTPNGHKISLFLEEAGLPYNVHPINISQGEQFQPRLSENRAEQPHPGHRRPRRLPMAASHCRCSSPGRFFCTWRRKPGNSCPKTCAVGQQALQWLFWQMGGLGPMAGQNHHFSQFAPEKIPYAIKRYIDETARLYGVLNKQLADNEFVAGSEYSIADMAIYPWIVSHKWQSQNLEDFPHVLRWFNHIKDRPATVKAYALVQKINPPKA